MTLRQKKYVKYIAYGHSKNESLQMAGYASNVSSHAVEAGQAIQKSLKKVMEKSGITDDLIAKSLKEGIKSNKTHFFTNNGKVVETRETKDMENRHRFLRTALEVRGDLSEKNDLTVNLGIIELPEREKDENSQ